MNRTRSIRISRSLMSAVLLTAAPAAWAQGVGNPGSLPTQFQTTAPPTGWVVVHPSGGTIPVVRDPLGPVWQKHFTGPNGQPFQALPFQSFPVQEALTVAGNLPWMDWHEEILNPDWSWTAPSILVNGMPPTNLSITNIPGNSTQGGILAFNFDPVLPGSTVIIAKSLIYTGIPGTSFSGTLLINEYPTPEPTSLCMLAGASALTLIRRRKRALA